MYKLLSIDENQVTRDLLLENLENHTHETCFDDSILLDFKNFDFMEIGQIYECKILLFGDLTDKGEPFIYLGDEAIGNRLFCRLSDEKSSLYYIEKRNNLSFVKPKDTIYFSYSRKDLIQVDDVIYPTYR